MIEFLLIFPSLPSSPDPFERFDQPPQLMYNMLKLSSSPGERNKIIFRYFGIRNVCMLTEQTQLRVPKITISPKQPKDAKSFEFSRK